MSNHGDADDVLHVAIVGGGLSGLASAYHLMQRARRLGAGLDIHLYETRRTLVAPASRAVRMAAPARDAAEAGGEQDAHALLVSAVQQAALELRATGLEYSCGHFFEDCLSDPEAMLGAAARTLGMAIDWRDPGLADSLVQVRDRSYYPRIAAQPFCDPDGPAATPLRLVLEYLRLQEGGLACSDSGAADEGARKWAETLAGHLASRSDSRVAVAPRTGGRAQVRVMSDVVEVQQNGRARLFDLCVMTTSAGDALRALAFDSATAAFGVRVGDILESVNGVRGASDRSSGADAAGGPTAAWPLCGVDWQPVVDRPGPWSFSCTREGAQDGRDDVLRTDPLADLHYRSAGLPGTPPSPLASETPADADAAPVPPGPAGLEDKAWNAFRRHVLDAPARARVEIQALNEAFVEGWQEGEGRVPCAAVPPLLFVGRWTHGASHHEQCLEQAEELSAWVLPD